MNHLLLLVFAFAIPAAEPVAVSEPVPDPGIEYVQTNYDLPDPHTILCWTLLQEYLDLLEQIIELNNKIQILTAKSLSIGLEPGDLTELLGYQAAKALLEEQAKELWTAIMAGGCLLVPTPNQPPV